VANPRVSRPKGVSLWPLTCPLVTNQLASPYHGIYIVKSVKDRLRSLFRAWLPAGHRSGIGQMIKDVSRISMVCLFAIFQARNDPVWFSPHLVTRHIDKVPTGEWVGRPPGRPPPPVPPPYPWKKRKKIRGRVLLLLFFWLYWHIAICAGGSGLEFSLSLALLLFFIQLL
jgi:hypothetical protein